MPRIKKAVAKSATQKLEATDLSVRQKRALAKLACLDIAAKEPQTFGLNPKSRATITLVSSIKWALAEIAKLEKRVSKKGK